MHHDSHSYLVNLTTLRVTHKWGAQVIPGQFEWPLSERKPPGIKDVDPVNKTMNLQVDDVFRLVEMTLLLGVITPLSIRWMQKYWHLGIQVHRFVNVVYFVDIVRRHTHPHSWVLNTPVFVIWILDKIYSMDWRRIYEPNFTYEKISDDYMVLYWQNEHEISQNLALKEKMGVGSNYFMKLYPSSWLEPLHTFTAFTSRSGNCDHLLVDKKNVAEAKLLPNKKKWNSGAVIRIFHNDRKPQIGSKFESRSHTERISKAFEDSFSRIQKNDLMTKPTPALKIWGPFQGDMTEMIPRALLFDESSPSSSSCCRRTPRQHLVLVGSGSAINFIIDFMSYLLEQFKQESIETTSSKNKRTDRLNCILLYSTRDEELFNWSVAAMSVLQSNFQSTSSCTTSDHFVDNEVVAEKRVVLPLLDVKVIMSCTARSTRSTKQPPSPKEVFKALLDQSFSTKHTAEISFDSSNDGDDIHQLSSSMLSSSMLSSSSSSPAYDREGLPPTSSTTSSSNENECSIITSSMTFLDGRIDYTKEIPEGSIVFCQGSIQIQNAVRLACSKKKHVRVHFD